MTERAGLPASGPAAPFSASVAVPAATSPPAETTLRLTWRRFRKSTLAKVGGAYLLLLVAVTLFARFFSPHDPNRPRLDAAYMPPQRIYFFDETGRFHWRPFTYGFRVGLDPETWARRYEEDRSERHPVRLFVRGWEYRLIGNWGSNLHLFGVERPGTLFLLGTDKLGRDLFSRILHGGRVSLLIALACALMSGLIGATMGAVSGFFGGRIDMAIQRLVELLQSFPALPLWMALSVAIPKEWPPTLIFFGVVVIFAALSWTWLAREVRGKVLSLRDQEFVVAARAAGAGDAHIIFRHVLPNVLSHIIVVMTIAIPELILAESALSFLCLGIQPPLVSWGVLLNDATTLQAVGRYPWILLPGVAILCTVLAFNFLGDGLRDAADPQTR